MIHHIGLLVSLNKTIILYTGNIASQDFLLHFSYNRNVIKNQTNCKDNSKTIKDIILIEQKNYKILKQIYNLLNNYLYKKL